MIMAKKQHVSRIETQEQVEAELKKLKMALEEPNGELPTTQSVNESVESLTTTIPKRIEKDVAMVATEKKKVTMSKDEIERGRDARGELNRVGTTVLFDRDLLKQVKIHAVKNGVSMSDIVNDALNKYLTI